MKLLTKIKDYFAGSISEMKKVVWPTKKQTTRYSAIVIAMSLAMAVFFGVLDYVFNIGLESIIDDSPSIVSEESLPVADPTTDLGEINMDDADLSEPLFPSKPAE